MATYTIEFTRHYDGEAGQYNEQLVSCRILRGGALLAHATDDGRESALREARAELRLTKRATQRKGSAR